MPRIIAIELTNRCNLRCSHCPQGTSGIERGDMSRETLVKCLEHCSGYTELNWRGEPLLRPDIVECVALVKQLRPDLRLGFHTNALLLTREGFHALADAGLDWLHISLHTPASCRQYLSARDWNQQRAQPLFLYADADTTEETLQALSCGLTLEDFHRDQIANWAGFLTGYADVTTDPGALCRSCPFVVQDLCIAAWDGRINACCWDFEATHVLGHVDGFASLAHRCPYPLCAKCIWVRNYGDVPE